MVVAYGRQQRQETMVGTSWVRRDPFLGLLGYSEIFYANFFDVTWLTKTSPSATRPLQ